MDQLVTIRLPSIAGETYDNLQTDIIAWLKENKIAFYPGRASQGGVTYAERVDKVILIHYRFANQVDAMAFKMRWG
jgi:hypothetical protein